MTPQQILRAVFGYEQFRGPQQAIVEHVVSGQDALVLMPTGGGKSLCYQIPAIARQQAGHGITLVVSPLIALMHNQVGALHEAGVEAAFLNSSLSHEEAYAVEQRMLRGDLTLLYAAPERINTPRFLSLLNTLFAQGKLALFAIDEAHCVSQWGHDFRPEYRSLAILHQRFPGVPRLALTATADALTRDDILERLQLQGARAFVSSFDRPNIRYTMVEKRDSTLQLLRFIERNHPADTGIVYCQSRRKVDQIAQTLVDAGLHALPYHAGMEGPVRQANQDRFLREDAVIMVATIAFGMGIDRPDVRFVAHLDMPKNIEAYYQETGRAGRDGLSAYAWMAYGLQDVVNQRRMIDESPATDDFKQVLRGKLDALLGMVESCGCRRVQLLAYFGESAKPCGNCDNCLQPPAQWDGTEAARMLLSTVYRLHKLGNTRFGSGHVMDIVRGKTSDKVRAHGHETLSTFGVGAAFSEVQLRGVLRQLISIGALAVDSQEFNTLQLTALSRAVLRGERSVVLRESVSSSDASASRDAGRSSGSSRSDRASRSARLRSVVKAPLQLDSDGLLRYAALKSWRAEVAREHNLPAYVIFHDATLAAIAQKAPSSMAELQGISGIGVKKLDAYAQEVLRVVNIG